MAHTRFRRRLDPGAGENMIGRTSNHIGLVYERRWLTMKFLSRLIATWLIVAPFMVAFFLL